MHTDTITFYPLQADHAGAASALALTSFERFVAPDWEPTACAIYAQETGPDQLAEKLRQSAYALGAFAETELAGFLLMPKPSLIQMFFVAPARMRQGIGRALWEATRAHLEVHCPEVRTVELNASPYALRFYRTLGFVPISAQFFKDGFRATRMACWLPARQIGAELARDDTA